MLAGAGSALAGPLPSNYVWSTDFSRSSDSAGFNVPSDGGTHGNCTRRVTNGVAWYTHVSSASDGGATRCYPAQVWKPDYFRGVIARGRYYVDVNPAEVGNDEFLSLVTLSLYPTSLVTVNLKVDSTGPTAGRLRLLLWHTPSFGDGDQTRNAYVVFPTRQWVEVVVTLSPAGTVQVFQDGRLVLTALKRDAPGHVEAVHFGGYASAAVSGWTIGNDDLRLQTYGTSLPPVAGGAAPPPAASAPAAPNARRSLLNHVRGGTGPDKLKGSARRDRIVGGAGGDRMSGFAGRDLLYGGGGDDVLFGGGAADRLAAGPGDDIVYGGSGDDRLIGGPGRDAFVGGPGDDLVLSLDGGEDSIRCGPGYDRVIADPADKADIHCESVKRWISR